MGSISSSLDKTAFMFQQFCLKTNNQCFAFIMVVTKNGSKKLWINSLLYFYLRECLLTRLHHLKCIRLSSVRSSRLLFKMHWVGYERLSLPVLMHVGSIATQLFNLFQNFLSREISMSRAQVLPSGRFLCLMRRLGSE